MRSVEHVAKSFFFNEFHYWINLLYYCNSRGFLCPARAVPTAMALNIFKSVAGLVTFKPRSRRSSNRIIQYFNLQFKVCNFHRNLISESRVFSSKKEFWASFWRILDCLGSMYRKTPGTTWPSAHGAQALAVLTAAETVKIQQAYDQMKHGMNQERSRSSARTH